MTPDVSRATDTRLLFMRMGILAALEDAAAGGAEPTSSSTEFANLRNFAGIDSAILDAFILDAIPAHAVNHLPTTDLSGAPGLRICSIA